MFYFSKNGIASEKNAADAFLTPPIFESNGREMVFATREDGSYALGAMNAYDTAEYIGDGLFLVTRKIENTGRTARTGRFIAEVCDLFEANKNTIPCVMFDANKKSGGKEPHGLEYNGEPWKFSYDRVSIPSCTITENGDTVCAMFASDKDEDSLVSACAYSVKENGLLAHRIYYPVVEGPLSYVDHDVLGPRYDTYMTLFSDTSFTVSFYVYVGTPKWENYGTASVIDRIENVFEFRHSPALSVNEVKEAALKQSKFLLCDYNGVKMFRNAMRNDPNSDEIYQPYVVFECGWSGQSFMQARHFIEEYVKTGEKAFLDDALSCLDAWAETQFESGLFQINYRRSITKEYLPGDVCNFGWAAAEMAKTYTLLKSIGIDRTKYLEFAIRICDFFVENYDEKTGYGLRWDMDGTKIADGGSIGGFMIMAMLEVYKVTANKKYLDCAKKGMKLYAERDVDNFVCTAGAIDCACVDKETAYPFIRTALDLYEITNEPRYLEIAEKAAYYFQSWMFYYDAIYPGDSEFSQMGYYTSGGTAVSTQHPAIDPWGAIAIPEYMRLAKFTADKRWLSRARALWCNTILCITPKGGIVFQGHKRPEGIQSEAFFQTRWTRYRKNCEERGHLNDMFVGWPSAFRLDTINRIEKEFDGDFSVIEKRGN